MTPEVLAASAHEADDLIRLAEQVLKLSSATTFGDGGRLNALACHLSHHAGARLDAVRAAVADLDVRGGELHRRFVEAAPPLALREAPQARPRPCGAQGCSTEGKSPSLMGF